MYGHIRETLRTARHVSRYNGVRACLRMLATLVRPLTWLVWLSERPRAHAGLAQDRAAAPASTGCCEMCAPCTLVTVCRCKIGLYSHWLLHFDSKLYRVEYHALAGVYAAVALQPRFYPVLLQLTRLLMLHIVHQRTRCLLSLCGRTPARCAGLQAPHFAGRLVEDIWDIVNSLHSLQEQHSNKDVRSQAVQALLAVLDQVNNCMILPDHNSRWI